MGGPFPDGPSDPARGRRGAGRAADAGPRRHRRAALFRVRRRRRRAGRPRRRLAGERLGPERRRCTSLSPAAAVAEEVAAAWLIELLDLPAGTSVGFVTGRDDGQLHRARRGAPRVLATRRLGRRAARACRARRRSPSSPTRHARHGLRVAPDARHGPRGRSRPPDRRRRPGPDAPRRPARGPGRHRRPDDRVRPGRQREQRRVRSARGDRRPIAHERGAWVHVDGAFGIWAAAVPSLRR